MKKLLLFLVFMGIYANAQIVNIPDANFKAKLLSANASNGIASTQTPDINGNVASYNIIDTSGDGEIQVSEAQAIKYLKVTFSNITNLTGVESFENLQVLNCSNNQLINLDATSLINLKLLSCSYNHLWVLNVSDLTNLLYLDCQSNELTSLDIASLINLQYLRCHFNVIPNLNVSGLLNLKLLDCRYNQLTNINVSNLFNLEGLYCGYNQLTNLNMSSLTNLKDLECAANQFSNLNFSGLTNLESIDCSFNAIPNVDFSNLINLQVLNCSYDQLSNLNILNLTNLTHLDCSHNQLTSLNVSGLANLINLYCFYNQITNINFQGISSLQGLECHNNQLVNLDVTGLINLQQLNCYNNQLNSLLIKNEYNYGGNYYFYNNPNLQYICCSDVQLDMIQSKVNAWGYASTCHINNYCSFTPGGTFYIINGTNHYDENNNGCDAGDITFPNFKVNITNGNVSGSMIADTTGNYSIPVQAGTHTLTPQLENPNYFNVSPVTASVTFPTQTSPFTQDFCIMSSGVHKDVEITLIPTSVARPGFPANYKLIYKNKGTITVDGTIAVNFSANPDVMHFQSATPNISSMSTTELFWDYTALQPFEIREINFAMLLNTPTDTPPLNAGNYLGIDADITPVIDDENYIDNHSEIKQLVVNSFDPNDKTCLEGQTISNSMIGQYVHYMIRFENTGTYPAQNIVVKDMIDTTKFDVSTLQMTKASHDCYTRINGNKVEFIFENINLPFDDANNDGYVVFKIKTLPTLAQNSSVSNTADIFFDYNFPITTNTATTNFANLNTQNLEKINVSVYPNPAKNSVNIKSESEINSITIFDIQGRQVQTKIVDTTETSLDISNLQQGNYLLKINTNKGIVSEKIVKE